MNSEPAKIFPSKLFPIKAQPSFYTHPESGERLKGTFLSHNCFGFYHDYYVAGDAEARNTPGTVANIVTTLKNQFNNQAISRLRDAMESMKSMLQEDFSALLENPLKGDWVVCVIPRAKAESAYNSHQQLFREAVKYSIDGNPRLIDGTHYITRHTNTITTHMFKSGYGGDGKLPYPGITKDTCHISSEVRGKNIILIDDLYTAGVNIDEDAIQVLFDNGAEKVILYVLGKTCKKHQ